MFNKNVLKSLVGNLDERTEQREKWPKPILLETGSTNSNFFKLIIHIDILHL